MNLYVISIIQILLSLVLAMSFINGEKFSEQYQKSFSKEELVLSALTIVSSIGAIFYKSQILLITALMVFYALLILDSIEKHSKFNTCSVFFANIVVLACVYSVIDNIFIKASIVLLMSFQTSFYLKVSNIRFHILKNLIFIGLLLCITGSVFKTIIFCSVYIGLELFLSFYTKKIILIKNNNLIRIATRFSQVALMLLIIDKGIF